MSAIIYPPVDPPQVLETLCVELRECCADPVYLRWIDIGGGTIHWAFCDSNIQRLENTHGEKYNPYQYDVYEMPLRDGLIANESVKTYKVFYEGPKTEVQILSESIYSGNNWEMYVGLNGTTHIFVRVIVKAGGSLSFVRNKTGLYRLEVEFSLPRNYNMIQ